LWRVSFHKPHIRSVTTRRVAAALCTLRDPNGARADVGTDIPPSRRSTDRRGMASRINRERKRTSPRGSQRRPERLAEETIAMTLRAGKYPAFAQPNCSESQAMSADKHHQIWIEQCEAARTIRERYGLEAAFDYAVGEKLMNFASAAHDHPAFARELPRFVSEVRRMYSADEIRTQLARLEREQIEKDAENSDPDEDEVLFETPAMAAERIRQFATIKDLLTADTLGTS
jgi:hypothetical protein